MNDLAVVVMFFRGDSTIVGEGGWLGFLEGVDCGGLVDDCGYATVHDSLLAFSGTFFVSK